MRKPIKNIFYMVESQDGPDRTQNGSVGPKCIFQIRFIIDNILQIKVVNLDKEIVIWN